jgi:competence protein ComEA
MAEKLIVNINSADKDTLQQLPGVGKSLAERIIEGRPYLRVDDLLEIPGVGKARFERLRPHLEIPGIQTVDTELEFDQSESLISEDGRDQDLSIERIRQGLEKLTPEPKTAKPKRAPIRNTLNRVETLWLVFGVGFITILLSVITTLVIMVGINNTLDFNRLQSIQDIDSNLADLERQLVNLSTDLESVDRRLQPLEGLSGRMVSVEEELGSIQGDVDATLFAVGAMQTELDFILTETTRLSERVVKFDNFLDGLEELMRVISDTELVE